MYDESNAQHHDPHIHAKYGEYLASFTIDGSKIIGDFPDKQKSLVIAWIAIHHDELKANWELLQSGQSPYQIKPLE